VGRSSTAIKLRSPRARQLSSTTPIAAIAYEFLELSTKEVSANQFRRPIGGGSDSRTAYREQHSRVGGGDRADGCGCGCGSWEGEQVQSSQCFIKDYLCAVVPVPSVRACVVCLCVLRSE